MLSSLGRHEEALAAYDRALGLDPNNAAAHKGRGQVLSSLGQYAEAQAAFNLALALDPGYPTLLSNVSGVARVAASDQALTHENQGIALAVAGDLSGALAEFDAAEHLTPDGAGKGQTWAGAIFWHRRNPAAARERFAMVQGRVTGCTPFHTAELEAIALCGLGRPGNAEQHLRRALPQRAAGDAAEPRAIYDLLADPPLSGIDRLRAIIENET